jgi:hypothetical protein
LLKEDAKLFDEARLLDEGRLFGWEALVLFGCGRFFG